MEALFASPSFTELHTLYGGCVHHHEHIKEPSRSTVAILQRSYRRSIGTELRATGRNRKSGGIVSGRRHSGTPQNEKLQAENDTTLPFLEPHIRRSREEGHEKSKQEQDDEEDALAEAALEAVEASTSPDGTSSEGEANVEPTSDQPFFQDLQIDLNFPRRKMLVEFTCNACNSRTQRVINPEAYRRGTVFVQCGGCEVYHQLVDNLNLIQEFDFREDDG